MKLGNKEVKIVSYTNELGETVDFELVGTRGTVWQVIRNGKNAYSIRNGNLSCVALHGNYTLTVKNGNLTYT